MTIREVRDKLNNVSEEYLDTNFTVILYRVNKKGETVDRKISDYKVDKLDFHHITRKNFDKAAGYILLTTKELIHHDYN